MLSLSKHLSFLWESRNIISMVSDTKKLIISSKIYYQNIGTIYSPALDNLIRFNRHGWKHLLFDSHDHRRSNSIIRLRLHLLRYAPRIIKSKQSTITTSYTQKKIGRKQIQITYIQLFLFDRKLNKPIKVIIRKFPQGQYHFFSIRRAKK